MNYKKDERIRTSMLIYLAAVCVPGTITLLPINTSSMPSSTPKMTPTSSSSTMSSLTDDFPKTPPDFYPPLKNPSRRIHTTNISTSTPLTTFLPSPITSTGLSDALIVCTGLMAIDFAHGDCLTLASSGGGSLDCVSNSRSLGGRKG
jgi:hypothetical protein